MNFRKNKMPSSLKELEWHWGVCVKENIDFSRVTIDEQQVDFNMPLDYFDLTDAQADKMAFVGRRYSLFSHPVAITDVELRIFGDMSEETQVGGLLGNIKKLRPSADVYGLYAVFKYIEKSVYCAINICFVDKDSGEEMEAAVIEIGEDEDAYILPVEISEEVLDFYSYDDITKLSYWLGNFWAGVQYELNNCPEEIRIIEQRGSLMAGKEEGDYKALGPVLVKHIIPVDRDGNKIIYGPTSSGKKYSVPAWGVRGHSRTLPDGRTTHVRPYKKGKERNKPDVLSDKEYRFVDTKVDTDVKK